MILLMRATGNRVCLFFPFPFAVPLMFGDRTGERAGLESVQGWSYTFQQLRPRLRPCIMSNTINLYIHSCLVPHRMNK